MISPILVGFCRLFGVDRHGYSKGFARRGDIIAQDRINKDLIADKQ